MKLGELLCSTVTHFCPDGKFHHFLLQCYTSIVESIGNPTGEYSISCGKYGFRCSSHGMVLTVRVKSGKSKVLGLCSTNSSSTYTAGWSKPLKLRETGK